MPFTLKCESCGKNFNSNQPKTKTCSLECKKERTLKVYGIHHSGFSNNFCGALHEYKTYMVLAEQNIQVYKQFLDGSKIDAIIMTPKGTIMTMDVKTGYQSLISGRISTPKHRHKVDLIACYVKNTQKVYFQKEGKEIALEQLKNL